MGSVTVPKLRLPMGALTNLTGDPLLSGFLAGNVAFQLA